MTTEDRPDPETIGQRLRRLRLERSLSQRALASPGVSYAYISRIEAGTRQPSVKAVRMLARKLGVSPVYLETGSEVDPAEERELRLAAAELSLRLSDDPSGRRANASRPRRRGDPGRRPRARRRAARPRSASSPSGDARHAGGNRAARTRADAHRPVAVGAAGSLRDARPRVHGSRRRRTRRSGSSARCLERLDRRGAGQHDRLHPVRDATSATRSATRTTSRARRPRCAALSRA